MAMHLATETLVTEPGTSADPRAGAAPPLSPEKMQERFPQFEIVEFLGRGGMGEVYKARQKALDREVAIKLLAGEWQNDEAFAKRFETEAKTLAQMSHPNIVTVHDFGESQGSFYIVMEYIDGVNLRDLLSEGKMSPEQALAIVPSVCEALEYAHSKGVVHRDIKPENLLLDRDGRVKIADFGIASLVGAAGERSGTPPYMAPEQEKGTVDRRADIYALGVVLYEMLTGERPGKTEILAPSQKVEVDVRIDEMVMRALEREPERRYQTAREFATIAKTVVSDTAAQTSPRGTTQAWRGVDFKSRRTLLGMPLVHIASGIDPATGRRRVATGIIAIGDTARGVIAFGGMATGGIALGGCACGIIAFGGAALGLISLGGLAIALLFAIGGGALGLIAIGGGGAGYLVHAGGGAGTHVLDARTKRSGRGRFLPALGGASAGQLPVDQHRARGVDDLGVGLGGQAWARWKMSGGEWPGKRTQRWAAAVIVATLFMTAGAGWWIVSNTGLSNSQVVGTWLWEEQGTGDKTWITVLPDGSAAFTGTDAGSQSQFRGQLSWSIEDGTFQLTGAGQLMSGRLEDGWLVMQGPGGDTMIEQVKNPEIPLWPDLTLVEDQALRVLVAIREKDDDALQALASERVNNWREAVPVFASELRERYRHVAGNDQFSLFPTETRVQGNIAAVRCTGSSDLGGKCVVLAFAKSDDNRWENCLFRTLMDTVPLQDVLLEL